jgi:WD40 repeat protein
MHGFAFSHDGKMFAASILDKPTIHVWDVATGKQLQSLEGHKGAVRSLAFSPDGSLLVSGGEDHSVRVWKMETGKEIQTLNAHRGNIYTISFSPIGKYLATGSADTTLLIWNVSEITNQRPKP